MLVNHLNNSVNVGIDLPYPTSIPEEFEKASKELVFYQKTNQVFTDLNSSLELWYGVGDATKVKIYQTGVVRKLCLNISLIGDSKDKFVKELFKIINTFTKVNVITNIIIDYALQSEKILVEFNQTKQSNVPKDIVCNPCYKLPFQFHDIYLIESGITHREPSSQNKKCVTYMQSDRICLSDKRKYVIYHPNLEIKIEVQEISRERTDNMRFLVAAKKRNEERIGNEAKLRNLSLEDYLQDLNSED